MQNLLAMSHMLEINSYNTINIIRKVHEMSSARVGMLHK